MSSLNVSVGRVHDVFFSRVKDLAEFAGGAVLQAVTGQRRWFTPGSIEDNSDSEQVTAAFDRTPISENYQACLRPSQGTAGDAVSLKIQGDYVACMERAYRMSVASPVRCIGHSLARRVGHSRPDGIFTGSVAGLAQSAVTAGQGG